MSDLSDPTLSTAVERYIHSLMLRKRSANYILRARNYLDQLSDHLGSDYLASQVSHADLEKFVRDKDIAYSTAGGISDLLNACLTLASKAEGAGEFKWFAERAAAETPST